ncbi:hypothetical protein DNTS_031391 [Danionella cerebrum]|uniref:SEA domain-containing protein n=1 Tax=Danionella cerebrum TaxID=2873325 RepID=A0A553MMG1_9TELE|nr:hypothetical protein DNTS_031391 [Danionella translucida]
MFSFTKQEFGWSLLEPIYKSKYPSFIRITVTGFRPGSIITDTELLFNSTVNIEPPTVQEISNTLVTAVTTGNVDPLKINPLSISVNGSFLATTEAPKTTTASSGLKLEFNLLQATLFIIAIRILRFFL